MLWLAGGWIQLFPRESSPRAAGTAPVPGLCSSGNGRQGCRRHGDKPKARREKGRPPGCTLRAPRDGWLVPRMKTV
ncbi:Hypothetical Protein RSKD131_2824 [Cereibacter sphaeroides KD131]|nr:Hypothetical Protein RSKD131_2824 [Cereibacter sphaeroides KD131]